MQVKNTDGEKDEGEVLVSERETYNFISWCSWVQKKRLWLTKIYTKKLPSTYVVKLPPSSSYYFFPNVNINSSNVSDFLKSFKVATCFFNYNHPYFQ